MIGFIDFWDWVDFMSKRMEFDIKYKDVDLSLPSSRQINATFLVVLFIALTVVGLYVAEFGVVRSPKQETWGQFGDYLGGILNPIVAFIALVVLVKTYRHQKQELAVTANALREEQRLAIIERQEARFFDLVTLYLNTVSAIRYVSLGDSRVVYEGKRAFEALVDERLCNAASLEIQRPEVEANVRSFFEENGYLLDHYFRVLFIIISTSQKILANDDRSYVKLLRAQLSEDELVLIGLNLFRPQEKETIELIAHFGLLKHFPAGSLRSILMERLPSGSFG